LLILLVYKRGRWFQNDLNIARKGDALDVAWSMVHSAKRIEHGAEGPVKWSFGPGETKEKTWFHWIKIEQDKY